MSEEFIDQVLAQFAEQRESRPEHPARPQLAWQVLQSGQIGLLRAARDADGDLLLQNFNLDTKYTSQIWISQAAFAQLRALLDGAPGPDRTEG